jgi:Response regulator containing CheY-like receiver domain and AraC-type DNA-binding domain
MFPYQTEGITLETTKKIRIVVVDDQAVVRQGFVSLINTVADMEVIAEGTNGQQAIELYREHQPDVMLIDLRMPCLPELKR